MIIGQLEDESDLFHSISICYRESLPGRSWQNLANTLYIKMRADARLTRGRCMRETCTNTFVSSTSGKLGYMRLAAVTA